jgi:hypothetical protein
MVAMLRVAGTMIINGLSLLYFNLSPGHKWPIIVLARNGHKVSAALTYNQ